MLLQTSGGISVTLTLYANKLFGMVNPVLCPLVFFSIRINLLALCQVLQLAVGLQREFIPVFLIHTYFPLRFWYLPFHPQLCGVFSLNASNLISQHFKKRNFKNQLGIYNTEELWKFLTEILWSAIYCQLSETHLALLSLDMSDIPHFTIFLSLDIFCQEGLILSCLSFISSAQDLT